MKRVGAKRRPRNAGAVFPDYASAPSGLRGCAGCMAPPLAVSRFIVSELYFQWATGWSHAFLSGRPRPGKAIGARTVNSPRGPSHTCSLLVTRVPLLALGRLPAFWQNELEFMSENNKGSGLHRIFSVRLAIRLPIGWPDGRSPVPAARKLKLRLTKRRPRPIYPRTHRKTLPPPERGRPESAMKVRNSLKSLRSRHRNNQLVRRRG